MTSIIALVKDLHLPELVDAYAELIRSRAFFNHVIAFTPYALCVAFVVIAFVIGTTIILNQDS